jgi:hypothetical protein
VQFSEVPGTRRAQAILFLCTHILVNDFEPEVAAWFRPSLHVGTTTLADACADHSNMLTLCSQSNKVTLEGLVVAKPIREAQESEGAVEVATTYSNTR